MTSFQRKNSQRDSMAKFINPDNGYRGKQKRLGIQPKNHMSEHRQELRMAQLKKQQERDEENRAKPELYKLAQFRNISSKLHVKPERQISQRRPSLTTNDAMLDESNENKDFLSKGSSAVRRAEVARENRLRREELDKKMEEAKYYAQPNDATIIKDDNNNDNLSPRKPNVPKAYETAKLAPASNTDFITRNKVNAVALTNNRTSSSSKLTTTRINDENDKNMKNLHMEYGKVPEYLQERKKKWKEEEDEIKRNLPDPDCPPGMCLMPESERIDTLEMLTKSKQEAMQALRSLPFIIETPSLKKKKDMLENKLREIDNALGIFMKPKVFIAMNR